MDLVAWLFMAFFFGGPIFIAVIVGLIMYSEKGEMGLFESPQDWGVNDVDQRKR